MASLWAQPSLEFGVKVVRVAGLEPADQRRQLEGGGALFVRYYVPAGDGTRRRICVDTREVPCGSCGDAFWGELARFERWDAAAGSTLAAAPGGGIVFELRWRPAARPSSGLTALLRTAGKGGRPSSRVLARAELAWQDAAASSKPPAERWLTLSPAGRELGRCNKAPKLLVEVDVVNAVGSEHHEATAQRKAGGVDPCCSAGERCGQCGWVGSEEDMFLAATFSQ